MAGLSVLVLTLDEEGEIAECLAGAAFADEIVVVDSGSTDRTVEIAEAAGARVLHRDFDTHAAQKNWGLSRLRNDWVLILDADERVTPELAAEIRERLAGERADGYWIYRRNTFLGRPMRGAGWDRDRVLRFFDRRRGAYAERRVHEEVRIDGRTDELRARLVHHSCRELGEWIGKTRRYARLGAEELRARGRRAGVADLVFRPPARFLKQYVLQGGFRDGTEGFLLCVVSAFGVFLKYAFLRESAE